MLQIIDERAWRRRRRLLLMTVFGTGALAGALMMNAGAAGSGSPTPEARSCASAERICGLRLETRLQPR